MMMVMIVVIVLMVKIIGKNSLPQHEVSQKSFKILKASCGYSKKCHNQLKGRNRTCCSKQLLGGAWDGLPTSDRTKESRFTQLSDACY